MKEQKEDEGMNEERIGAAAADERGEAVGGETARREAGEPALPETEPRTAGREAGAEDGETGTAAGATHSAEPEKTADELREELNRARERVTQLERERILLGQGVPEDDLDYYVFKIGKLAGPEMDFDAAAREYLKEHGVHAAALTQRSTGASLSGRAARTRSTSDTMNRLLRGM